MVTGKVRDLNLPLSQKAKETPREGYILDSAHHGIAMNSAGTRLWVAGTISDYVAIVDRETFRYKLLRGGKTSYWSTTSGDGRKCYVSWSKSDKLSIISYRKKKEIASVPVGFHPQRVRTGYVRKSWIRAQDG